MFNLFKKIIRNENAGNPVSSKKISSKRLFSNRNLYLTKDSYRFWLNPEKYLDQTIINTGIFEEKSTLAVKRLVKKNDIVLDIGANIGYYTVIFSHLVGSNGKVLAFEPTKHYRKILKQNLRVNRILNCKVFDFGLSDRKEQQKICIGDCSATIHWTSDEKPKDTEMIALISLDEFIKSNPLKKINFIKIDVDGHEPLFFKGAWKTLEKYNPVVLMEINQENYLRAGFTAWDFYDLLKRKGYKIYSEDNLKEFETKRDFLIKCANFAYSANIIISRKIL